MASTTRLPGVYLHEQVETLNYGDTGQVPVFVGKTNNSSGKGTEIHKYYTFDDAAKSIADGGIGQTGIVEKDLETNPLLNVLQRFFNESQYTASSDEDVPYVYVIDVGDGTILTYWKNALNTMDLVHDINIEAFYGIEYLEDNLQSFLELINAHLTTEAKQFMFARAYITLIYNDVKKSAFVGDLDLIDLAQDNLDANRLRIVDPQINDKQANTYESKTVDPYIFGQFVGRVCVTPRGKEAGYYTFNTISAGTFCKRTKEKRTELMQAGVIFGYDEYYQEADHPRINLNIGTSFGNAPSARPADSLDYARRICDYILLQVYDTCYPFVKEIETRTNITILQTKVNLIINNAVNKGWLVEYTESNPNGSYLKLEESDSDPFAMIIRGKLQPVKEMVAIDVETTITSPAMQDTEAD